MKENVTKLHEVKTGCPDEATLAAYLDGSMTEWEKERLEEHAAECRLCLENIRTGHLGGKLYEEKALGEPKRELKDKAKGIAKMDSGKRRVQSYLWLTATVAAFLLSFIVPKYFAQFLVAALIFGLKWVSESENVRMFIVAMDARRRSREKEEDVNRWR